MKQAQDFFERQWRRTGVRLNDIQQQAVLHTTGPLLLLASPGSGKTTTIIMRIGYLIEEMNVPPARIKAVTFSRASANDMRQRFQRLFPHLPQAEFSTIHSFAFQVVREHLRASGTPYRIIEGDVDATEQERVDSINSIDGIPFLHKKTLLRKLYRDIVGENITDDQLDELTTYISYIKNKLVPDNKRSTVKTNVPQAERIMREYEKFKRVGTDQLLLDYDDMLTICEQVLARDERLRAQYQARYDYILTDESQDTSMVQHMIIEKLAQKHRNLCVVADEDQSLYSWRGAEPAYLLNFKQMYPEAEILYMEQNYRSSQNIVEVANQFIKRNKARYDKNMFTENPSDRPIVIKSFANYTSQTKYLVQDIQSLPNLTDVAVLYRNHASAIALMNALDRAGIPFYMKDSDTRFFSHWVVEDILNFMRMTYTDKRPDILEKIHLKMNGYISKKQMAELLTIRNQESVFDNLINHVQLQDYQVKQLQECKETFQQMKGMPPLHAIRVIRDRLGYEKALEKLSEWMGFRKETLIGILNTLEEIAVGLTTMEQFSERLKYLSSVLKTAKSKRGQEAITLSTLHSSKGLEFEQVYMIDLIEGVLPSKEDREDPDLMEEAVRLFYVGMTRAKKGLELITYRERDGEATIESQFVTAVCNIMNPQLESDGQESSGRVLQRDLKSTSRAETRTRPRNPNAIQEESELQVGLEVKHATFGSGKIIDLLDDVVYVRFAKQDKALSITTCVDMGLLERVNQPSE